MNRRDIDTAIGKYQNDLKRLNERIIADIGEGQYEAATMLILDAVQRKGIINELRFQLEVMEVNGE